MSDTVVDLVAEVLSMCCADRTGDCADPGEHVDEARYVVGALRDAGCVWVDSYDPEAPAPAPVLWGSDCTECGNATPGSMTCDECRRDTHTVALWVDSYDPEAG